MSDDDDDDERLFPFCIQAISVISFLLHFASFILIILLHIHLVSIISQFIFIILFITSSLLHLGPTICAIWVGSKPTFSTSLSHYRLLQLHLDCFDVLLFGLITLIGLFSYQHYFFQFLISCGTLSSVSWLSISF